MISAQSLTALYQTLTYRPKIRQQYSRLACLYLCFDADGTRGDSVEPSDLGDQFDLTSSPSIDAMSTAFDEIESARQTCSESDFCIFSFISIESYRLR